MLQLPRQSKKMQLPVYVPDDNRRVGALVL